MAMATSYPPIVWADVVAIAGAEFEAVPDAARAMILNHVNTALRPSLHTRARLKLRRVLLAAHFGYFAIPDAEDEAGGGGGGPTEYAGPITSEEVGDIKRTFGKASSSSSSGSSFDSSAEALAATEWGQQYLALRPARARLPIVL